MGKLKVKTTHFRSPSASQKRACLSFLLEGLESESLSPVSSPTEPSREWNFKVAQNSFQHFQDVAFDGSLLPLFIS